MLSGLFDSSVWLNEAVTEAWASRLLELEWSYAYGAEREALDSVYAQGLSKRLLDQAYFEDGSPQTLREEGASWHELTAAGERLGLEGGVHWIQAIGERLLFRKKD